MAKSLKEAGMDEVTALRRRVNRQLALNRIGDDDAAFILEHLDKIQERIEYMYEEDLTGREFV